MRVVLAATIAALAFGSPPPQTPVTYQASAIRFGILPAFPVSGLVAGAECSRALDIPVMVWLLKGSDGRQVLIDSGFYRQTFVERWKVRDFRTPAAALEAVGVKREAITDIVISHAHWDHVDGVDLFPAATVWIQRDEYRYYTGEAWQARNTHGGIDQDDMQALLKINMESNLKAQGRMRTLASDLRLIVPGHDPAVFTRFPSNGDGSVAIR